MPKHKAKLETLVQNQIASEKRAEALHQRTDALLNDYYSMVSEMSVDPVVCRYT